MGMVVASGIGSYEMTAVTIFAINLFVTLCAAPAFRAVVTGHETKNLDVQFVGDLLRKVLIHVLWNCGLL